MTPKPKILTAEDASHLFDKVTALRDDVARLEAALAVAEAALRQLTKGLYEVEEAYFGEVAEKALAEIAKRKGGA